MEILFADSFDWQDFDIITDSEFSRLSLVVADMCHRLTSLKFTFSKAVDFHECHYLFPLFVFIFICYHTEAKYDVTYNAML